MNTGIVPSDVRIKYDTDDEIRAIICHERIYDRIGRDDTMVDTISIITNHAGVLQRMTHFLRDQLIPDVVTTRSSHKDGQSGYLVQVVVRHKYFNQVYKLTVDAISKMLYGNNFGEGSAGGCIIAFTDLYREDIMANYDLPKVIY